MNSWAETLEGTLDHIWQMLERGTADRRSPIRHPVLATLSKTGPETRILVLRKATRATGSLTLYTDAATPKVAEMTADPRCALHFWDPRAQIQLRFRAKASLEPGSPEVWDRIGSGGQELYGVTPAPGTRIDDADAFTRVPDPSKFLMITLHLQEIDYTNLSLTPHRRAQFAGAGEDWVGHWVAP